MTRHSGSTAINWKCLCSSAWLRTANGHDRLPRLADQSKQAHVLDTLSLAYQFSGQPGRAVLLSRHAVDIDETTGDRIDHGICLCNLAQALLMCGIVYESESAVRRAL